MILVEQVSLHACIVCFTTELCSTNRIAYKTNTFGCHYRQPSLCVFGKKQDSSHGHPVIWKDEVEIPQELSYVMSLTITLAALSREAS